VLDYAANAVVFWSIESLKARFEQTARERGEDPQAVLSDFLDDELDADQFWPTVKTNLEAGKLRLVFVADEIPNELKRIVEFLNEQMARTEVLAISVSQYRSGTEAVLVPRLIGRTATAEVAKAGGVPKRTWDRSSVLERLEADRGKAVAATGSRLMDWAGAHGATDAFGSGGADRSWWPVWEIAGHSVAPFKLYTGQQGRLEIDFKKLMAIPPFTSWTKRAELKGRLEQIPGVIIPPKKLDKRPGFLIGLLSGGIQVDAFEAAMTWVLEQVEHSAASDDATE
jgi:uncharacterized protein (DUF2384 family)